MKITNSDYTRLETIVQTKVKALGLHNLQDYPGMSTTRYIWDIFHAVTDSLSLGERTQENVENYLFIRRLYDYLGDAHIETAMRSILRDYLARS